MAGSRSNSLTASRVEGWEQRFADAGYSLVVFIFDCFGQVEELETQIQRFGEEVIPAVKGIKAKGGWASWPSPT
jgi:hypothetical protein